MLQSYDYRENGEKTATTSFQSDKSWIGGLSVNDDTADSGLYLMGHRHYDSSTGRFLSRDPIGFAGGWNLFEYANNSPVAMVDPRGLDPLGTAAKVVPWMLADGPEPGPMDLAATAYLFYLMFAPNAAAEKSPVPGTGGSWTTAYFDPNNADGVWQRAMEMARLANAAGLDPCSNRIELTKRKFGHTFTVHGQNMTNFLTQRAKGSGMPQGQWLNDQLAAAFLLANFPTPGQGEQSVLMPEGLPHRIIYPDGSFGKATHVKIVPSGTGIKVTFRQACFASAPQRGMIA